MRQIDKGVTLSSSDLETLLFYSFRYALGHSTYAVSDITQLISDYEFVLQDNTRAIIIEEIKEAVIKGRAGMDMDVREWTKLLEELK